MGPEDRAQLRDLLTQQRVLSLAVLVDGAPVVGLLPFAMLPGYSAAIVHASALARHTAGLKEGAPFSLLIHQPDQADADPLQLPRVTLQGTVRLIAKGSDEYAAGRVLYLGKFPQSEQTFVLGDFNLYALVVESGRYIGGFARAFNLTRETLDE